VIARFCAGNRAGDEPLSAARLSRHPRSFGFADRFRNRGAFIGGGLWT